RQIRRGTVPDGHAGILAVISGCGVFRTGGLLVISQQLRRSSGKTTPWVEYPLVMPGSGTCSFTPGSGVQAEVPRRGTWTERRHGTSPLWPQILRSAA